MERMGRSGPGAEDSGRPEGGQSPTRRLGVISDTHGLLRPAVFDLFDGVEGILHAGDVGSPTILDDLAAIAPVTAVWGNVDGPRVRERTSGTASGEWAGISWAMAHGHAVEPVYERLLERFDGVRLVVHGHTHSPALRRVGPALLLNPGAAGPRRFDLPASVALVEAGSDVAPRVVHLDLETGRPFRPPEA